MNSETNRDGIESQDMDLDNDVGFDKDESLENDMTIENAEESHDEEHPEDDEFVRTSGSSFFRVVFLLFVFVVLSFGAGAYVGLNVLQKSTTPITTESKSKSEDDTKPKDTKPKKTKQDRIPPKEKTTPLPTVPLKPGDTITVSALELPGQIKHPLLVEELEKKGVGWVNLWFAQDAGGLRQSNRNGIQLLVELFSQKLDAKLDAKRRDWPRLNLLACLRDSELRKGTPNRVPKIHYLREKEAYPKTQGHWVQLIRDSYKGAATAPGNPGTSTLQEVALNACLVRVLTNQRFTLNDLTDLYKKADIPKTPLPNGFVSPEQLFAQLYHYLESESMVQLKNNHLPQALLDEASLKVLPKGWQVTWNTGWDPNPADTDDSRLSYSLDRNNFVDQLTSRLLEGVLVNGRPGERISIAHGPLFYRTCINKLKTLPTGSTRNKNIYQYTFSGQVVVNEEGNAVLQLRVETVKSPKSKTSNKNNK